jgi:uncharacterized membrane protein YoaK (UPF0700 family)
MDRPDLPDPAQRHFVERVSLRGGDILPAMNRRAPPVKWTAFPVATAPPRAVPILLAAVAGYVDACTFLGLFGFFVAQVTGSYVLAGAQIVTEAPGIAALIAVPVFFAGGVVATVVAVVGQALAGAALASALALETLLLIGFIATFAAGTPFGGPAAATAVAASMFGLAAMGVQSATVRLLMRGVASTSVMTANTSQIAIDATQLVVARLCGRGDAAATRQCEVCRRRLRNGLPLPLGFVAGTAAGAVAFAAAGFWVLAAPAAAVGSLAVWAARRRGA